MIPSADRLTLARWLKGWPYKGRNFRPDEGGLQPFGDPDGHSEYVVADANNGYRTWAWDLCDYRVTTVTGGSIWFAPRKQ